MNNQEKENWKMNMNEPIEIRKITEEEGEKIDFAKNDMVPPIVQVVPQENGTVYVYFEDGKTVLYDVNPLFNKGVFRQLKNKEVFLSTCTILNDTLAWNIGGSRDSENCIDIAPDTLYSLTSVDHEKALAKTEQFEDEYDLNKYDEYVKLCFSVDFHIKISQK